LVLLNYHHLYGRFGKEFSFMSWCFPIFFPPTPHENYRPPVLLFPTITHKMMTGKGTKEHFETLGPTFLSNGTYNAVTSDHTDWHTPTAAALQGRLRALGKGADQDLVDHHANYALIDKGLSEGQAAYSIIRKQDMPTPPTMAGRQDTVEQRIEKIRQHQVTSNDPHVLQDHLFQACDGCPSSY
jgi:hypothetical protein